MKKIMIVLMSICLICTAITACGSNNKPAPGEPTPTPNTIEKNADDLMLFSFEEGGENETAYEGSLQSLDLSNAPWHQSVVTPLCVSYGTDTGKGFKMPLNHLNDAWYQTLRASTTDEYKTNIDQYQYLRIWVNNVGEGTLSLGVLLSGGMYYYSFLNAEKAIVTESNGSVLNAEKVFTVDQFIPEAVEHGYDSVIVPSGFSGWIAFPILENTVNYWTAAPVEKLSGATVIDLLIQTENQKTEYYVIDDVCLTNHATGTIR